MIYGCHAEMIIGVVYIIDLDAAMGKIREKLAERDKAVDPDELRAMVHGCSDDNRMFAQSVGLIQGLLEEKSLSRSARERAQKEVVLVQKVRARLAEEVMGAAAVVQGQIVADNHEIVEATEYVRCYGMFSCDFGWMLVDTHCFLCVVSVSM